MNQYRICYLVERSSNGNFLDENPDELIETDSREELFQAKDDSAARKQFQKRVKELRKQKKIQEGEFFVRVVPEGAILERYDGNHRPWTPLARL